MSLVAMLSVICLDGFYAFWWIYFSIGGFYWAASLRKG
jgi:hypothetical protein